MGMQQRKERERKLYTSYMTPAYKREKARTQGYQKGNV
jgi:hypothetical protein